MNKLIFAALVMLSAFGLWGLLDQGQPEQVSPSSEREQLTSDPEDIIAIAEPEYQSFEEELDESEVLAQPNLSNTVQDHSHVKIESSVEEKAKGQGLRKSSRERPKSISKESLDENEAPALNDMVEDENEVTTAKVAPETSLQEFRKKWLPIPSSTLDKFDRSEEIETCRNDVCQPIGRRGVLLTGVVIQMGAFQGQIQPGNYLDQTPMLYLQ